MRFLQWISVFILSSTTFASLGYWTPLSLSGAPEQRKLHSSIWTGDRMLVWGGIMIPPDRLLYQDGGLYNPKTDSWLLISTKDAPDARFGHSAVWTGSKMLIWGGARADTLNTGGVYNLATDSWTSMTLTGAPMNRYFHEAVWMGTKMFVWGGFNLDKGALETGGIYELQRNKWTDVTLTNSPGKRHSFSMVWTGKNIIVWGGINKDDMNSVINTGGIYNSRRNSWSSVTTTGAPTQRAYHTAVWTGSKMIIWGGHGLSKTGMDYLNTGAIYDPGRNTWRAISTEGAPSARHSHVAVWTGSRMIVWGGLYGVEGLADGGIYNPQTDKWEKLSTQSGPIGRFNHTAAWTGDSFLVWGGVQKVSSEGGTQILELNDGGKLEIPVSN